MKVDPYKHKERYKNWLEKVKGDGEISLRELDIKANTNYQTIRDQVKELEYFGIVEIIKHKKSEKTGRPFTSVKLKR